MTEVLPAFALQRPATLAEAAALGADAGARFVAGGTDLVPNLKRGLEAPATLVDLTAVAELRGIRLEFGGLRIGAGTTLAEIERDPLVAAHAAVVAAAAATVAAPAHRASATLGGNLCLDTRCVFYNQSPWWRQALGFCLKRGGTVCHVAPTGARCHAAYSGDVAPALLVLGAAVELFGPGGTRTLPLAALHREDGRDHLCLGPGEIVAAVRVPVAPGLAAGYAKARVRGAIDFPLAGVAVALRRTGDRLDALALALTGTNSRPLLLQGTDELLGRALDDDGLARLDKLVQKQVSPMRTTTASSTYRRRVAAALACRLARRLYATGT